MKILVLIYRALRNVYFAAFIPISSWKAHLLFSLNGVHIGEGFSSKGSPLLDVSRKGKFNIGCNFNLNSGKHYNLIGGQYKCSFVVGPQAELTIGDNVGMSNTAIVCHKKIIIANNVKIGGNVKVYDTDFHSLAVAERNHIPEIYNVKCAEVLISEGAFIGAHAIILKGTVIGKNCIIGAGSLISGHIPDNEIWAGNPAKFIKSVNEV
ncbi:MAG: acyltransferase [Mucilaginibacter sp.]|nr:acyltransferase [Mucilaginibacter sp.]